MRKRSSKDINQLAASIVERSTRTQQTVHINTAEVAAQGLTPNHQIKNPAAVELGRLGGLKGGKVRAQRLTAARRKSIAAKAAKARWKKHKRS